MSSIHRNLYLGNDSIWTLIVLSRAFTINNPHFLDWLGEMEYEEGTTKLQLYRDLSASLWFKKPEDITMLLLRWGDQLEKYPAA